MGEDGIDVDFVPECPVGAQVAEAAFVVFVGAGSGASDGAELPLFDGALPHAGAPIEIGEDTAFAELVFEGAGGEVACGGEEGDEAGEDRGSGAAVGRVASVAVSGAEDCEGAAEHEQTETEGEAASAGGEGDAGDGGGEHEGADEPDEAVHAPVEGKGEEGEGGQFEEAAEVIGTGEEAAEDSVDDRALEAEKPEGIGRRVTGELVESGGEVEQNEGSPDAEDGEALGGSGEARGHESVADGSGSCEEEILKGEGADVGREGPERDPPCEEEEGGGGNDGELAGAVLPDGEDGGDGGGPDERGGEPHGSHDGPCSEDSCEQDAGKEEEEGKRFEDPHGSTVAEGRGWGKPHRGQG